MLNPILDEEFYPFSRYIYLLQIIFHCLKRNYDFLTESVWNAKDKGLFIANNRINRNQVYGIPWKARKRLRAYAEGGWVVEIANRQLDN